jgi:hypothetical protein
MNASTDTEPAVTLTQHEVDEIIDRIKAAADKAASVDSNFRLAHLVGALSVILYRIDPTIADTFWAVAFPKE